MIKLTRLPVLTCIRLFVFGLALILAGPSIAGGINNSNVRDLREFYSATKGSKLDTNDVLFRAGQSAAAYNFRDAGNEVTAGTYIVGYAYKAGEVPESSVNLTWYAFEPDSVKRSEKGMSIRQRGDIALSVSLFGGYSSAAQREGVVSGCSVKGKLKIGSTTKASASMKCPKSVWEDLGFTANQVEKIQTILGTRKIKFGYKGETLP